MKKKNLHVRKKVQEAKKNYQIIEPLPIKITYPENTLPALGFDTSTSNSRIDLELLEKELHKAKLLDNRLLTVERIVLTMGGFFIGFALGGVLVS